MSALRPAVQHLEGKTMNNNVLTASRMNSFLRCQRAHYYRYELGLQKDGPVDLPLRFGSAWARAMDARWKGYDVADCYAFAVDGANPKDGGLDESVVATIWALLQAYCEHWGEREKMGQVHSEVPFAYQICSINLDDGRISEEWNAEGKLDGLGQDHEKVPVIIESKTTRSAIDSGSRYWERLRFNVQLLQYVDAARKNGWDVREVIYDVVRKPAIRPHKKVYALDAEGNKIIVNARGRRAMLANGKYAKTANAKKGWTAKSAPETPEQFGERLLADVRERPEFYFQRRRVPILDSDLSTFHAMRMAIVNTIRFNRQCSNVEVWHRNVSQTTCDFCQFAPFCLQNVRVNPEKPPVGYSIKPFNPELEIQDDQDTNAEEDAAAAQ